jgi:hypothetical protein
LGFPGSAFLASGLSGASEVPFSAIGNQTHN